MKQFSFEPAPCVPFRDRKAIDRVRKIRRADMARHRNKSFKISIIPDEDINLMWVTEIFHRIHQAAQANRRQVLILPNPSHSYRQLAWMINKFKVSCRKLHVFIMDEYADEHGNIAPETWPLSFMHSFKQLFISNLEPKLRPPAKQVLGPTTRNISDYGKMIADLGGADACYSGPGWTGHLAFIEPDAPEFEGDLEAWKKMRARIVTLSPFTIAQNSLHGFFGMAGDLAAVPPKAATIGPAEVIGSKYRLDISALTTAGTSVSWQRMITRLCTHGPVTPLLPTSLHQELKSDKWISETIAADIEPLWNKGY